MNQPPPLELFSKHGSWNNEHKHRWFDHKCSFARARESLQKDDGFAPEHPSSVSLLFLFDLAVRCLTWMPVNRPTTNQILEELQSHWPTQDPGVVPSSSSQGAGPSSSSRQPRPTFIFRRRLGASSSTLMDLSPSESEDIGVGPASAPAKRRRISSKSPSIQPKQNSSSRMSSTGSCAPVTEKCQCQGNNCRTTCHVRRGEPCQEPAVSGSKYCKSCKCRSCNNCRRGYSGLCRGCEADDLPWGLQLLREFGRLNLVESLQPVDVEVLLAFRAAMIQKHKKSHAVLEFSGASGSGRVPSHQLADGAPKPNCTAKTLLEHLHKTLRAISDNRLQGAEAGACIHGGRHTGLAFCMRWIGVAAKVSKATAVDSPRGFQGGAPFVPFAPKQIIHNVGCGTGLSLELGTSLVGLDAIIEAIRTSDSCASDGRSQTCSWAQVQECFGQWIEKITAKLSMGLTGNYVTPHILRKFLILNGDLPPLTVQEMQALVPDEQHQLSKIPASLKDRGRLASALACPDIYITCYNCRHLSTPLINLRLFVCFLNSLVGF